LNDLPQGYRLARYETLDSTNAEAARLAQGGEHGPLWILALSQTAGRGRRGRLWQSLSGNLFATLLIRPDRPEREWPTLSFVTALAVADMAQGFAPAAVVTLKWPNDVLLDGRKLAGILLERTGPGLAIGVGANLAHCPPDTEFPATALAAAGVAPPSADTALTALAASFAKWYERWTDGGFSGLKADWLARAAGLHAPIRARLADGDEMGLFEGIDDQGALLLRQGESVRAVTAGEVFF
jgi:BirA family biotin operon repressor/biotin-[acetyl-CoA-carboxylase] ligase